jgi:O-antigen/teichoic acid export membrane protein
MNPLDVAPKVLSGLKWAAMIRITGQLINWGMSIIVIRYIKPEEYGLKSMADIFMGLFIILSSGGMESAIIQAKELTSDKLSKVFGLLIAISFVLFTAQTLGAYPIAEYYREPRIIPMVQVMALGFLLVPFFSIPSAMLSRDMEYKLVGSISLITNIIGGACTLAMALQDWGVWSLIAGPLVSSFLNVVILNVCKPCLRIPRFSMHDISEMALFGGTVVLTSLLWVVYSKSDIFIAGRILSAHDVGIYAVALHLASLPVDKIMPTLNQVAFPAYAKLRDNPEIVAKFFLKSIRLSSLVLFPISFGLIGISQYLVPVLLGEKWGEVSSVLLIVGLVFPLRGISSLCAPMTNAIGKPKIQLQFVFMATAIMVPSFAIGVNYGITGLALTWVCVYPWIMIINILSSLKHIKLKFIVFVRAVFPPIVLASIMLYGLLYFSAMNLTIVNLWVTIGVMVFSGVLFYSLGIFLISRKTFYELLNMVTHKS